MSAADPAPVETLDAEHIALLLAYLTRASASLDVDTAFVALALLVSTLLGATAWAETYAAGFARPTWQRARLDRAWGLAILRSTALDLEAFDVPGARDQLRAYADALTAAVRTVPRAASVPRPAPLEVELEELDRAVKAYAAWQADGPGAAS